MSLADIVEIMDELERKKAHAQRRHERLIHGGRGRQHGAGHEMLGVFQGRGAPGRNQVGQQELQALECGAIFPH